jgi:pyroglutamyl-peptidase
MPETLYLTGFGAFPGVEENPTEPIAHSVHGARFGRLRVWSEVLPVSFARAASQVRERLTQLKPRWVIHLGVAVNAQSIRLEAQAINCATAQRPDVDTHLNAHETSAIRALTTDLPIDHCRATGLALSPLLDGLNAQGFVAERSIDAGRYVCNSTYFHTLEQHPHALFVHIPMLGAAQSATSREPEEIWTAERLNGAIHCLLKTVADLSAR